MSQTAANQTSTHWDTSLPLRVLVIERRTDDAEAYLNELQRTGFHCRAHIAGTRDQVCDHLRRFHYDVVLADYHLSGWSGMDALALVRESLPELPFILVSGALGEEAAVECIRLGVTDYVLRDRLWRLPVVVARSLEEKTVHDARTFMVEALLQSESNSLFLFAHNPLPMWVFERETLQFLQVNDTALLHYGYGRIEFLRMSVSDLHPPEEIPGLLRAFHDGATQAESAGQWHHRRKDGSLIDVEMFMHSMKYGGRPAALVVALDITERMRAEEEWQKFFTLVENSSSFIAVSDLEGILEYVNPAGRALLGMSSSATLRGTQQHEYVATEDLALMGDTVFPAIRSSGHWQGELRFRHYQTGRVLPMDYVGFLVKDPKTGEPRFVATVSRDVTEHRALEKQLQQSQKFEAIGQLAGGIAHDFNNVIGAILGWAEIGEEQAGPKEPRLGGYFREIHTQCDRVTALVRQLLAFARQQTLEPRKLNLNESVHGVLNLLAKLIGKNIELHTDLADDLAPVCADPTQIEQVLLNLCINSRDAMPTGGRLSIETRNTEFSPEECPPTDGVPPRRFAQLSITDTGVGMDAAVRERIFEPFFTTKGSGKGTGLGLSTVYGIVKQHGGFIRVESEPDRGSRFRVFLPVNEDAKTTASPRRNGSCIR